MLHSRNTNRKAGDRSAAGAWAHTRRGITLLELMIALVMVGILAGIALSKLDYTKYRADSVARGVLTDLANAQRLAVSLQADVRVEIPYPSRMTILEDLNDKRERGEMREEKRAGNLIPPLSPLAFLVSQRVNTR